MFGYTPIKIYPIIPVVMCIDYDRLIAPWFVQHLNIYGPVSQEAETKQSFSRP